MDLCVGIPSNREEGLQRISPITRTSKQRKERENTRFKKFSTICLRPRGKGREFLLNQSITGYEYWGHHPSLYSQRNHEEKETINT